MTRYKLIQDEDSHWYVIPADKENEFDKWLKSEESEDGIAPDWANHFGGGPGSVTFEKPEIFGKPYNEEPDLRTSQRWSEDPQFSNIIVMDYGGWDRKNFAYSWYIEKISAQEYRRRFMMSTCTYMTHDPRDTGQEPSHRNEDC